MDKDFTAKVNRRMSDVVRIIKESFLKAFNEATLTAEDFRHVSVTHDIYDESRNTIDFTGISKLIIKSNEESICYIIQRNRTEDEAIFFIMWTDYNANLMYNLGQFPMIKITKDVVTYRGELFTHPALEWQDIALPKIKAMFESENENTEDTTENETLDEEFKNRISYIMDHVLELLIDETKKVLNKDVVTVDCYESFNEKPSRQFLNFKGVDISNFVRFGCNCGSWNVRKSPALSYDNKVTYCITWWPNLGLSPTIIITRNGCKFGGGDRPRNDLMNSVLPKIKELCLAFNDNTPKHTKDKMITKNELYDIMHEYIRPELDKCTDNDGHWRNSAIAHFCWWGLDYGLSRSGAIIGFRSIKEDGEIIGFDICNSFLNDKDYVNIKIRKDEIEFIEDSKFKDFNRDFMYGLYEKIKEYYEGIRK